MIQIDNLYFKYKSKKPLFNGLSLKLDSGHIYGLLGKNGTGKSTLLKHISGLLFPAKGTCKVFGYDPSDRSPLMLQNIFLIPEEFELPALELKTFVKVHAVFYPTFDHSDLEKYLTEFELPSEGKVSDFSHGQKKKFLLAFGLATNAKLIIMDEPTNGLDIPSKSQFRKIIASAMTEEKIFIISTHQVRDLENLIDVVVVLDNGSIVFNQTTMEISEKLNFEEHIRETQTEEVLYAEDFQGRRRGILPSHNTHETRVDLELLFNAVVKNNELINRNFN